MSKCDICKERETKIVFGSYEMGTEHLCFNCYNKMMEDELGVKLDPKRESFTLKDGEGNDRHFSVNERLEPMGFFIEAVENKENGYQFAVHGELDADQKELFKRLVDKVQKGIRTIYIEEGRFPSGKKYETIAHHEVRGRLEYDPLNEGIPLVVVDGKPYTWERLGEMVMSFEGFQIKMTMADMTDDLE